MPVSSATTTTRTGPSTRSPRSGAAWRRRGLALVLKRLTLAFAAGNGIREVYTWTQLDNADMRALNERLGYVDAGPRASRSAGPLPLAAPGD